MGYEPDRLRVTIDVGRKTITVSIHQPGLVSSITLGQDEAIWFTQSLVEAIACLNGSAVLPDRWN